MSDDSLRNDAQLIDSTLRGDKAAFGCLVERYQDRLYNSLYRVTGSAEDARDLVQDAFIRAMVKLDTFRGSSAFYTWLYRIAFHLAMSHGRKRHKSTSLDQAKESFGHELTDGEQRPEARLVQQENIDMVHVALAALNEEYRQILVLRELDGCRYDQIAEILDLPVGTVRSRLFRARMQLREQLAPMFQEDHLPVNKNT